MAGAKLFLQLVSKVDACVVVEVAVLRVGLTANDECNSTRASESVRFVDAAMISATASAADCTLHLAGHMYERGSPDM